MGDFLVILLVLVKQKVIIKENVSSIDHVSGIRLPDGFKLAINQRKDVNVTTSRHDVIVNFF